MGKVKNNQAIRRLSVRSFGANRTRNVIAAIAIALTAVLFTAVFTIAISLAQQVQRGAMRQAGGDAHGEIKNLSMEEYEILSQHPSIKECGREIVVADSVENPEFLKRHVEMHYLDENLYPHWFIRLKEGRNPREADEILLDEKSMELLGLTPEPGCEVTLEIRPHFYSEPVNRTFRVSGVIEAASAMNVGFVFVPASYLEKYKEEIWPDGSGAGNESGREDGKESAGTETAGAGAGSTGKISLQILFSNPRNIQEKLNRVITESGFSLEEGTENYIASNANWAYLSDAAGSDPVTFMGIGMCLVLIMVTGYLIIYNIFQISITRDIRYYGLIKTIGTTGRQIRKILHRQALWLCLMGMPAGLLTGFVTGKFLFPIISSVGQAEEADSFSVAPRPWIFIGAGLFTVVTVLISQWKPARIAGKVSPIEALRYTEYRKKGKKQKKTTDGGKLFRMAFSNLGRNKARTASVILSLSLTVILMNSFYTVTKSIDRESFLSKMILCEDIIGNAALWNYRYYPVDAEQAREVSLSESFIQACRQQESFAEGGRIYMDINGTVMPVESWEVPDYILKNEEGAPCRYTPEGLTPYNGYETGGYLVSMHGIEPFVLSKMTVVEGETDKEVIWEKLQSGGYLLYAADVDDGGHVIEDEVKHHAGDKVVLQYRGKPAREYEIISVIKRHSFSLTNRVGSTFSYYITAQEFKENLSEAYLMSYLLDAKKGQEEAMEEFLKTYTSQVEPVMSFESRKSYEGSFRDILGIIIIVGTGLCGMIGLIGILNFFNVTLTGIAARKREFAMMEAIGMTRRQLVGMLMAEGVCHVLLVAAVCLLFGSVFSFTALKALGESVWFIHYQFTLFPVLLAVPFLLVVGILVPGSLYALQKKRSIVEEIRE